MYRNDFIAAVKCRGSVLREFNGGIVKLPFGSDYSIVLKNKSKQRALVNVSIDGKDVMDGNKLIVRYDHPVELKGYMEGRSVSNSFRFIEKTSKIVGFRGNRLEDGLVEIKYSFEKESVNCMVSDQNRNSNKNFTYGIYGDHLNYNFSATYAATNFVNSDDLTVKGAPATQDFDVGSFGTTDSKEYNIVFKLQGTVGKASKSPVTVKTKIKCPTCGQKCKATDNYCSNCSTYIQ